MRESKRFLGIELAGAKNQKTALAALEYYPKEKKIFLLDVYDRIINHDDQSSDEALLELIRELEPDITQLGINVPLELPPCIECTRKTCPLPSSCSVPAVKWMRELTQTKFTPYTQRPIELWVRFSLFPKLSLPQPFEIDESLGGNRAPLTARMHFLKRHLKKIPLIEVWPKLTIAILAKELGLSRATVAGYRKLEDGVHYREAILLELSKRKEIFIYDRDLRKLSNSLAAFDAFICAFTALLAEQGSCAKKPKSFPNSSGWIHYPKL